MVIIGSVGGLSPVQLQAVTKPMMSNWHIGPIATNLAWKKIKKIIWKYYLKKSNFWHGPMLTTAYLTRTIFYQRWTSSRTHSGITRRQRVIVSKVKFTATLQWRYMGAVASQVTVVSTVRPTVLGADQRKHHCSASLAFVRGIHWWPVDPFTKGQ